MNNQSENKRVKKLIERAFELILWNSRLIVLLAVIFSALGAISLFIVGSYEIGQTILEMFPLKESIAEYERILIGIIGAIDLYLIGIVLLLFSFGVYELFISRIDVARIYNEIKILDIGSLDELKNKLLKVIIMVLVVTFFKEILFMDFHTPTDMLFFSLSILAVSVGVYMIRRKEKDEE